MASVYEPACQRRSLSLLLDNGLGFGQVDSRWAARKLLAASHLWHLDVIIDENMFPQSMAVCIRITLMFTRLAVMRVWLQTAARSTPAKSTNLRIQILLTQKQFTCLSETKTPLNKLFTGPCSPPVWELTSVSHLLSIICMSTLSLPVQH